MSQVNDALKRVRDTQQNAPRPAEAPPLRSPIPAPAPAPARGIGLLMPIVFIAVALLGLTLFLGLRQKPMTSTEQPATTAIAKPDSAAPANQIASVAKPKPALPSPPKTSVRESVTAAPTPAVPEQPTPVIKLQGILYSGHNSSAMISGQTVRDGDEVNGYRVAAIGQRSVTLVSATQTNVLSLNR